MKPRTQKRNAGFTLTEVVVSILILTVGILAAASTLVAVFNSRDYSKMLMTATTMAQQTLEDIKAKDYSQVLSKTETYGDIPGHEKYRRTVTVTPNAENTLKQVTVEVFSSNGQSIQLETLISRR